MTQGPTGPTVDLILPVLNEAEALPWVLGRLPPNGRAIVVDNGSTDGSAAVARTHGATVVHEPQTGFGAACAAGLHAATADLVAFMDCDATLDPGDIERAAAPVVAGTAELVLGARRPEPGAWPMHARLANRYLARRLRRQYGWAIDDLGPLRVAHREALLGLDLQDRRSGWPLEMLIRAGQEGWQVSQIDVRYRRREGRSKVTGTALGTLRAVRDMRHQLASM